MSFAVLASSVPAPPRLVKDGDTRRMRSHRTSVQSQRKKHRTHAHT